MGFFPVFKKKKKNEDFLVIEVGLERVSAAVIKTLEGAPRLAGIGRKKFGSRSEVFNSTIEALDALTAIVNDLPEKGIFGISGGSTYTATTIAHYKRPNGKTPINLRETHDVLEQVVENLEKGETKVFFSTIASAKVDGVKVANPIGIKGQDVEFSCFYALADPEDIEIYNKIVSEIEIKVKKTLPTSFTVAKSLEHKGLQNALIMRFGSEKSELSLITNGEIAEIQSADIGAGDHDLIALSWQALVRDIEKKDFPTFIWLYSDHDEVDLEKAKEHLQSFPWKEKFGLEKAPEIEVAETHESFSLSDIGIHALGKEAAEE